MPTTRKLIGGTAAVLLGSVAATGGASAATASDSGVPTKSKLVSAGWVSSVDVSDNGSAVVYDTIPSGSDTVVRKLWDRATGKSVRITSYDPELGLGEAQLSGDGQDVYWLQGAWSAHPRLRHWSRATGAVTSTSLPAKTSSALVSRNESTIIYEVPFDSQNALYQLDVRTNRTRNIAVGTVLLSQVSRTGTFVTYQQFGDDGTSSLKMYAVADKSVTTIAREGVDTSIETGISQDGNVVVFVRDTGSGAEVARWQRGSGAKPYSVAGAVNVEPSVSDDGLVTSFRSDPSTAGAPQGVVIATGTPRPVLSFVDGSAHGTYARSPEISGNGRFLAYVRSDSTDASTNGVYLWGPNTAR